MQVCSILATLSKFSRLPSSAEAGSLGYENESAFPARRADYSWAQLEPIEGDWNTSNIWQKGHHRRRKTARLRWGTLMDGLWQLDHHEEYVEGGASKG
jgi:hypothetical protein